ncbi:opioid growth factor receptor-like protein 1 [Nannospalax galili]|nr:opioid growth factor receptor-like protein 1 [Nannospalax galili]
MRKLGSQLLCSAAAANLPSTWTRGWGQGRGQDPPADGDTSFHHTSPQWTSTLRAGRDHSSLLAGQSPRRGGFRPQVGRGSRRPSATPPDARGRGKAEIPGDRGGCAQAWGWHGAGLGREAGRRWAGSGACGGPGAAGSSPRSRYAARTRWPRPSCAPGWWRARARPFPWRRAEMLGDPPRAPRSPAAGLGLAVGTTGTSLKKLSKGGTNCIPSEEVCIASKGGDSTEATAKPKRSFYAARDLYKYRHQYPQNFKDIRYQNDLSNLRFYKNKIPFKPDGVYIEEVLNKWKGDYEKLEHNHTYIQWLFPLREQGLNFYAKELTTYEIEEFKKTKEAIRRFLLAYKMMLEFFGIKLMDKTGTVARAVNWQERFQHLNESQHNYLRITRILKSLGELGYESFKSPLVKFILHEALVENTLPNIKQSALEYFVYTIRDRRERRKLLRFAQKHYTPSENFIWGPPRKEQSEGSKAQKMPVLPASGHNNQTSMHKKSKDSKNSSVAIHLNSKTVEEKKAASKEPEEETDRLIPEPSSDAAKPRNTEDSDAEESSSPPEKTVANAAGKRENPSPSEKDGEGENQSKDCEEPGNSGCQDEVEFQ